MSESAPRLCVICGQPLVLPQGKPSRRRYHDDCNAEARRRNQAVREGRDPFATKPVSPEAVQRLAQQDAGARGGGVAYVFWSALFVEGRTFVPREEVEAALGRPRKRNLYALAQLERLELLVEQSDGYEVRGPVTPEARSWVALAARGGSQALVPRRKD